MAAAVKQKLSQVNNLLSSSASSEGATQQEVDKYRLLVTAGPSYNQKQHQVVKVNTNEAVYIENQYIRAKISVRVRGFRGLPKASPASSTYFDDPTHKNDLYSVGFSFVPKQDLPSADTVWGNDFDHPIRGRIPPKFIFNNAFRIVKEFIDPGLECNPYADEPYLYGPSLSCWFGFRIGDKYDEDQDFPAPNNEQVLTEGADGSGAEIRQKHGLPADNEKRRKYFLSQEHRESFVFEKGRCYQADFYNPYIDFGNFLLKLPGFSLKVIKYVEDKTHCLRYVFKDRNEKDVYLNVNFFLIWGEQLERAIKEDEKEASGAWTAGLASVLVSQESESEKSATNGNASSQQAAPSLDDLD